METLAGMKVGAYLLEMCTPRAGEMEILQRLPADARIGVGVVNQKHTTVEPMEEVVSRIRRAIDLFGRERVLLHPDCGFATFADNPICSNTCASDKLAIIARATKEIGR
jgi:5-methyltetrahydropteroyltriglutamate--homocysteine methyltransferase